MGNGKWTRRQFYTFALCLLPFAMPFAARPAHAFDSIQLKKTIPAPPTLKSSALTGVAVDAAGNVYVAGYVYDVSTYDFGNNVTVQGVLASEADPVVLKYNSSGVAQWIKSAVSETNGSDFKAVSVATDGSGNIYAAGAVTNTGIVDFGNYVSVTGSTATNANLILVNYK